MEKITSQQVIGLMEAYGAVHAPQELTEDQVWEEVESWVNSLVEEGYDLSEYTWEEMYEEYLTEIGFNPAAKGSTTRGAVTTYGANDTRRSQSGPVQSRFARPMNAGTPQTFGGGRSQVRTVRPQIGSLPPSAAQTPRPTVPVTPDSRRDPEFRRGPGAGAGDMNAGRPTLRPTTAPAPSAARPAPAAPRPTTAPAAPTAAKPAATPARNGFGASTAPMAAQSSVSSTTAPAPAKRPSLASQKSDIGDMIKRSQARQGLTQSFDVFDVIKGHLIDEGYADTEEAALQIMANMSEEWREGILEGRVASETMGSGERRLERNDRYREENPTLPSGNPTGVNAQLMRQMAHAKKRGVKKKKN